MEEENYRSVCIEGGDLVGKGDATNSLKNELDDLGIDYTFSSFPIYATPIGTTIRKLLKEGIPNDAMDEEADLRMRMALFAMNRLEFMEILLGDEKYKDTLLVFDRSPFSNAVTIGYGMTQNSPKDMKKYVDVALDYDSFMISTLGLHRCVVQLERKWEGARSVESDNYESEDVQEKCIDVYNVFKKSIGEGWHEVTTKIGPEWVDREEIKGQILGILLNAYGDMGNIRRERRFSVGFKQIVNRIYPKAMYDRKVYTEYEEGVSKNIKDQMYSNAVILGKETAESCLSVRISNPMIQEEFRRLIGITPETLSVIEYFMGSKFRYKLERGVGL